MARPRNKRPVSVPITLSEYDGRWHAYKTVGVKANGDPDVAHRSGATSEECEKKVRELEDELAAGRKPAPRNDPKMAGCLTEWLQEGEAAGRWKYKTVLHYRYVIAHHLIPHCGGHRRRGLTPTHVKHMRDEVMRTHSRQAAKKALEVLSSHLSDAMREGAVDSNVAKLVRPPTIEERAVDPLTVNEVKAVIPVIDNHRNRARWLVAITTGLRQGECLGLMWHRPDQPRIGTDVDLATGDMTIREKLLRKTWRHGCPDPHACGATPRPGYPGGLHQTGESCLGHGPKHDRYHKRGCPTARRPCKPRCAAHARTCPQRHGGGLVREKPKSRAGERTTAIPEPVLDALRDWKVQQDGEREAAGDLWTETGHVFTTPLGRPVDYRRDWQEWQDILAEAGLPRARVHALRHSAATFMLVQGIHKRVVMELLGWSQESMLGRYQDVVDELKRDAAKRMGHLLWGKPTKPKKGKKGKGKRAREVLTESGGDLGSSTDHATGASATIIPLRKRAG